MLTKIKVLIVLSAVTSIFWGGWEWRDRSADLEVAHIAQQLAVQSATASELLRAREFKHAEEVIELDKVAAKSMADAIKAARQVSTEVIKYATNSDSDCVLSAEWVRIHNAAARGSTTENTSP